MNSSMLFIDTTGKSIILGAQTENGAHYYIGQEIEKKHASTILQKIEDFLYSSKINISSISKIGVVIGPGSFTGIRIGISTANALSKSLNASIISLNSLEIALFDRKSNVISVMDCLNGNYYSLIKTSENDYKYRILTKNDLNNFEGLYDIIPATEVFPETKLNAFIEKAETGPFLTRALPFYLRESSAEREDRNKDHYLITLPTREDIKRVFIIEQTSFHEPWSEKMIAEEIHLCNPTNIIIKDRRDDTIIGYVFSRIIDDTVEILRIAVKSEYKGAGFASLMINEIVERSRSLSIKSMILEVSCLNEPALRLYQKNGFIIEGRRKNYYKNGEDALLMRRLI